MLDGHRQGIGRSALIAAAVLASAGIQLLDASLRIGNARGLPVPETEPQRSWVERIASLIPAPDATRVL